jgi:hypothetical protein
MSPFAITAATSAARSAGLILIPNTSSDAPLWCGARL